jgi:hypothetical protein
VPGAIKIESIYTLNKLVIKDQKRRVRTHSTEREKQMTAGIWLFSFIMVIWRIQIFSTELERTSQRLDGGSLLLSMFYLWTLSLVQTRRPPPPRAHAARIMGERQWKTPPPPLFLTRSRPSIIAHAAPVKHFITLFQIGSERPAAARALCFSPPLHESRTRNRS